MPLGNTDEVRKKPSKIYIMPTKSAKATVGPEPEAGPEDAQDGDNEFAYGALRPIVIFGSFSGIMPLCHTWPMTGKGLQFRWLSWQCFFCLILLFYLTSVSLVSLYFYIFVPYPGKWDIEAIAVRPRPMIFNVSSTLLLICSIYSAKRLPEVLLVWDETAKSLRKYLAKGERLYLDPRLALVITVVIMSSAIAEHVMHEVSVTEQCSNVTDYFRSYYECGNEHLMAILAYDRKLSIFVFFFNKLSTVAWNFQDVFITLVCLSLRANFRAISGHVRAAYRKSCSLHHWQVVREDHVALCDVAKMVDDVIAPAVLISYMVNLYFICVQIFFAIRPIERSLTESIYFSHSFFHLLLRICSVSISAVAFYEEVRNPLDYLLRCPTSNYCEEITRFINHISLSQVAITGCNFFSVNRSLFLSIVGVIFTYELILLDTN